MSEARQQGRLIGFASGALLLLAWAVAAHLHGDRTVLPSPAAVLDVLWREARNGNLWTHLSATLLRVLASFAIAMSIGTLLGLLMGRSRLANTWLNPWLIALLNLPALVAIVLAYIWIGLNEVAAVVAVAVNKIPVVTVMLREGTRALDPRLDEMARSFRMPTLTRLRHVVVPQLAPHVASASRAGISLIWKIVLVVEFLGRSNGIGFQIHLYFELFNVAYVLAYAISFIVVMLTVEYAVLQPWEQRVSRWRRDAD
ncbi:ABC transporter permease [Polymorphum gilvum]|uniref:Aliphatic sulfonates transport permease protein, putative n=1 Tax=Polymorphum gilvum (strain LMG 25793 / CGMCC 1.9160 / SL003B-26A1) TaxID=991905 RepID=F2IXU9_POLGS|nr:ABC transporter permease [Polymorphum gilvum]ADZ69430.1 Aliphatic sulfonates transport permease protein, putative [Polymorphum gilvum SL003B-26A1]